MNDAAAFNRITEARKDQIIADLRAQLQVANARLDRLNDAIVELYREAQWMHQLVVPAPALDES